MYALCSVTALIAANRVAIRRANACRARSRRTRTYLSTNADNVVSLKLYGNQSNRGHMRDDSHADKAIRTAQEPALKLNCNKQKQPKKTCPIKVVALLAGLHFGLRTQVRTNNSTTTTAK